MGQEEDAPQVRKLRGQPKMKAAKAPCEALSPLAKGLILLQFDSPPRRVSGRDTFHADRAAGPKGWKRSYPMRITLERSNLLKSLNHVHRVVERRNTIPILSLIHI